MSKKETRRAARKAFPQAKPGTTARGGGKRGRNSGKSGVLRDARGRPLRPPTFKRAAIQGAILAILYFVVIEFVWVQEDPATGEKLTSTTTSLFIAVIGFVVYTGIAYAVDKFVYQRKLRKLKGSSK